MGNSWGHKLIELTQEEMAERDRKTAEELLRWAPQLVWDHMKCRVGKCKERAKYLLTYDYMTGRCGHVSWAEKIVCDRHGAKYREVKL